MELRSNGALGYGLEISRSAGIARSVQLVHSCPLGPLRPLVYSTTRAFSQPWPSAAPRLGASRV
jgi:hypothetical protein